MNRENANFPGRQRGAATLLVAMVLLIGVTLVVMVTARTSFMDQRISANEIRAKAAFEAAQAGMDRGIASLATNTALPAGQVAVNAGGQIVGFYEVAFCDANNPGTLNCANVTGCTNPGDPERVLIFSCGWSDDQVGLQQMVQVAQRRPAVPNPPSNPLTSRGVVNVQGSASVTNYFNNLTIWTGNDLTNIGNSGKTYIRNPNVPTPPLGTSPPPPPPNCVSNADYICTTDINTVGPDVIANDTSLSSLTSDQFFTNYFGTTPEEYKTQTEGMDSIVWLDGNSSLTGGTTLGTEADPVVVIVDGNLSLGAGNITVNGILVVLGDVNLSGNFLVNGSAIVAGNDGTQGTISGTGNLDVIYNPMTVRNAGGEDGLSASEAGSWRDWL